jgi:ABC-2 type transport system ATP-binding protein
MRGMATAELPALQIEEVTHNYGSRQALVNVTFNVAPATFTVLLGLNGAGKSTLLSLITRLYSVQRGCIRVFGHDVEHESGSALRMLGLVFQPRTLDLDLSVLQNLIYHAALHGIDRSEAAARARDLLSRAGLSERATDKARNLSGGQMRQVEIARSLLHRPRLLLLDEPTVGLDVKSRARILAEVRMMVAEGVSVLWATHLIDEVNASDDVVMLHQGRVLAHDFAARIAELAGACDMRAAFIALTQANEAGHEVS